MPERGDGRAIITEALCQMSSKRIRAPAEFAAGCPLVANVRGRVQTLFPDRFVRADSSKNDNKGRRGEIATAIHHNQARDDGKVVENQQHAPQPWMPSIQLRV